ncbi:TPR repeat protein [Burkholderiales bacterium GJ-E10]|nr:TPR repeat protein [Burkholderiales bacterium GJ-E10]
MTNWTSRLWLSGLVLFCATIGEAQGTSTELVDGGACGSLRNAYGPYDYRTIPPRSLYLVEMRHFPPQVETLQRGSTGTIGADLDYALRAIPNHPRILLAMMRLARRDHTEQPSGSRYSVQCWFDRAVQFAPDDPMVRMLYGNYLIEKGKPSAALEQLRVADKLATDDANLQYNLGLAYFKLKKYDLASGHARKAYAAGFPLPGLRDMLSSVGEWRDRAPNSRIGRKSAQTHN